MAKRSTISLRIDSGTVTRLERLQDKAGVSKSEVIRQAIMMMYETYDDNVHDDTPESVEQWWCVAWVGVGLCVGYAYIFMVGV